MLDDQFGQLESSRVWRTDMESWYERTKQLLGSENMEKLARSRVAVFGVGGVGGYVVEALARCGIGFMDLIDADVVAPSNINRQIIATVSTIGRPKVEAARDRVRDINPECRVNIHKIFYLPETADRFDFREYDYVVDAIDTVSGKLMLAEQAGTEEAENPVKVTSEAFGMANARSKVEESGAEITWDEETKQNFATWAVESATYKIWLEDEKSIEPKLMLMKEHKLAGTAAWALGQESSEIWNLIKKYVN